LKNLALNWLEIKINQCVSPNKILKKDGIKNCVWGTIPLSKNRRNQQERSVVRDPIDKEDGSDFLTHWVKLSICMPSVTSNW
jgi:hypothetical protein